MAETIEELEATIRERLPQAILETADETGIPMWVVRPEDLLSLSRLLKEDLKFDYPECLTGLDRGEHFEVVYQLYSMTRKQHLALKVRVPKEEPRIPSVAGIWRGMDWHEREAYDMLGILFEGHPDLRRILLPEDWEVFPLRKDYVETD